MINRLLAGRGLNERALAEILAEEAPARLKELVDWGFDASFHNGYLFSRGRAPIWGEKIIRCLVDRNLALGSGFQSGLAVADIQRHTVRDGRGILGYGICRSRDHFDHLGEIREIHLRGEV